MSRKQVILIALLIMILASLALLPVVIKKDSTINLSILILLFITLASSWNILGGYTGQVNLGHAAFFGLGTLATRLLWMSGRPLFPSLLAGGGAAVAFALLIGIPAFKLRGAYFAIGTLALGQILNVTVGNALPVISALPAQYLATYQLVPRYYLFLALALLTTGTAYVLVNSRLGLGMMAVREEEEAAESLGISALQHKLLALCVSAFFAGLAGGAFAYYHVSYYYQLPFGPLWTFDSMMMAYIGGTGTIIGPIIGAVFFVIVKEYLSLKLVEAHLIVFGVLFILVVLFLPGGFVEVWEKIQERMAKSTGRLTS
ncbi:MAG: branched-chain amino acid ABC transporter permease [Anaerolineales bacterium]|nr:MAG: branched-chain amino acid ABC transporter permease [Anaerolineales bacterium]